MVEPNSSTALIQQADQLATSGQWEEARNLYHQAVEVADDGVEVYEHLLKVATNVGDYGEVISCNMAMAELFVQRGEGNLARYRYKEIINLEKFARNQGLKGTQLGEIQTLAAKVKPEIFAKLGIIELSDGNYKEAVNWLKPSLELDPSRWDTHMAMGRALMASGKEKESIGEFQEVVRLAPNEAASAYEMLGEVFIRSGRPPHTTIVWFRNAGELFVQRREFADAIRTYERILQYEPDNKDILVRLGEIYCDEGHLDKASVVYGRLADIYSTEGLVDKMMQFYEKQLECDASNEQARNKLIGIYGSILTKDGGNVSVRTRLIDSLIHMGQYDEAAQHQLDLAQGYTEKGLLDEASSLVRKLLEFNPDNLAARRLMGDIYRRRNMNTEALAEYQEVVRIYRESGNQQAALDFQHQLVEMFPETSDLQYQVALTLRSQGDRVGAVRELLRLCSERPDDVIAQNYLAEEYIALDRWNDAIKIYRSILQREPGRFEVRKRLIKYFLSVGDIEQALEEISLLPDDDNEKVTFSHRVIEKCLELGRVDDAERYLGLLDDRDERKVVFRKELIKRYLDAKDLARADAAMPLIPRSDRERNRLVTGLMEQYLSSGMLENAAALVERLPSDDSLHISFQRRLVSSYQECGRYEDASAEMAKLPANDESRPDFLARQIAGLLGAGRLDEAISEIGKLSEKDPARNSFMGQLVEAYLQRGDIDRASVEVAKLSLDSEIGPRYRRRLIQAYLNANRLDEAERDILALDSSDPEKRSFLRLLLQKYEGHGLLDKLREVVLDLPDDMGEKQQYLDGIVHSYLSSGDLAQARQEVYRMAEQVSAAGNHAEAERLYGELLAYHPVDVEIRLRLCHEVAAQGKLERAREGLLVLAGRFHREGNATSAADIYSRLLEIDPDNLNARYRLGDIWAEHGQAAQALEQFSLLAKVYLQQNLPEVAHRVLHRILELDSKDIVHRRQLITLLTRNLRFEEATEHYRLLLGIHLDRGELEEARSCVREIVTLQPLNLDLRLKLGEMFLKAGFLEEGQGQMEGLASTYKGRGDHRSVVRVFQTLADAFDSNQQWETALEYSERVADEQVEADEWPQAQKHYLHALEEYLLRGRTDHTDPLFVKLIDGFFRHRNVPEGIELLKKIEERLADEGLVELTLVIRDRLAGIMERQEEWAQALGLVESISDKYLEMSEFDQAVSYCRRAADIALNHGKVQHGLTLLFRLANLNLKHRSLDSARPVLDEIRRRSGDNVGVLERIGEILFNQGLLEEARPIYNEVLSKDPARAESLSRVAIIYAREGRLEEAAGVARQIFAKGLVGRIIEEYQMALGYGSNDASYHIKMGEFYQQMGFVEEAIGEFNKAISDPAKMLVAVNHLALAFREKGYQELAIKQYLKAMDQPGFSDEDLLDLRYNLAEVFEQEGRLKEALQAYQECYAVDIRFRDVSECIERLFDQVEALPPSDDVYPYDDEDDEGYEGEE